MCLTYSLAAIPKKNILIKIFRQAARFQPPQEKELVYNRPFRTNKKNLAHTNEPDQATLLHWQHVNWTTLSLNRTNRL